MDPEIRGLGDSVKPPDLIIPREEEYAYGFIMEVLTRGLYPDKLHVVREYVQNAYDTIADLRRGGCDKRDGRIDIKIQPPSLFIFDNGVGMDSKQIAEYRYVGYSKKLTRESVGFRGIGKLSGISAAAKIIVTTSPIGSPERHRLVFDAEAMLDRVEALKLRGDNIALNQLITDHTSLSSYDDEELDAHYTFVELNNIRDDSSHLLEEDELRSYLASAAPVDFDPQFKFGQQIDDALREYLAEYDTVPLLVNGQRIFKPYLWDLKSPHWVFVWPEEQPEDPDDYSDLIAFAWYCEHKNKGQLPEKVLRGLRYRVKNFAVGENHLPRISLWRSTPERAFYFFGEIHVCDEDIVPSADRTNFEQNNARQRLYQRGSIEISRTLNKVAGRSSDIRRSKDFIRDAESLVERVTKDVEAGSVAAELRVSRIVDLSNAITNVEKRIDNAPRSYKRRGKQAVEEARLLVQKLDGSSSVDEDYPGVYDIKDEMGLSPEARWVYDAFIAILEEEFRSKPEVYEKLIKKLHEHLRRRE